MRHRRGPGENDRVNDQGWTAGDMPDLGGVRAVVTGANSGLGLATALELARHGASVVLAVRDEARGAQAAQQIRGQVPGARLDVRALDLADLASVRSFAAPFRAQGQGLDLLVNNAGVMAIPRRVTPDGFEMQFATNHLGHFALTGQVLPALLAGSLRGGPARVVTVSSTLHRRGRLRRDDLWARGTTRRSGRTGSRSWPTCCSCGNCSGGPTPPAPR